MSYFVKFSARDSLYEVGYFHPNGDWIAVRDFENPDHAYAFINFLSGGTGRNFDAEIEPISSVVNSAALLAISRVVSMLEESLSGTMGAKDNIAQAILNLNAFGAALLEETAKR